MEFSENQFVRLKTKFCNFQNAKKKIVKNFEKLFSKNLELAPQNSVYWRIFIAHLDKLRVGQTKWMWYRCPKILPKGDPLGCLGVERYGKLVAGQLVNYEIVYDYSASLKQSFIFVLAMHEMSVCAILQDAESNNYSSLRPPPTDINTVSNTVQSWHHFMQHQIIEDAHKVTLTITECHIN